MLNHFNLSRRDFERITGDKDTASVLYRHLGYIQGRPEADLVSDADEEDDEELDELKEPLSKPGLSQKYLGKHSCNRCLSNVHQLELVDKAKINQQIFVIFQKSQNPIILISFHRPVNLKVDKFNFGSFCLNYCPTPKSTLRSFVGRRIGEESFAL